MVSNLFFSWNWGEIFLEVPISFRSQWIQTSINQIHMSFFVFCHSHRFISSVINTSSSLHSHHHRHLNSFSCIFFYSYYLPYYHSNNKEPHIDIKYWSSKKRYQQAVIFYYCFCFYLTMLFTLLFPIHLLIPFFSASFTNLRSNRRLPIEAAS